MEGGLLCPPNADTTDYRLDIGSAAMEGGLLCPPNTRQRTTPDHSQTTAAMEGGLLCPPNLLWSFITDSTVEAAMEGGLLCPPNE